MSDSNKLSYAPFILLTGDYPSLILSDNDMLLRVSIFEEREDEGWVGNGYDWTSIAQVVLNEKLPDLINKLEFDPEAGMFSASGPIDSLMKLGAEMKMVFDDDNLLIDFLSRAELD